MPAAMCDLLSAQLAGFKLWFRVYAWRYALRLVSRGCGSETGPYARTGCRKLMQTSYNGNHFVRKDRGRQPAAEVS
jgi:hypothetical protein